MCITKIAVEGTVDPMIQVMECLFGKCETTISNGVLEMLKKLHSYTKIVKGKEEVYTFHKRVRGTDALFSFLITTGAMENKASNLECLAAELGVMGKDENPNFAPHQKVYLTLMEE